MKCIVTACLAVLLSAASVHRHASAVGAPAKSGSPRRPNVILVLTDDQGYGDLGCHGNPWLQTPNLDALYEQSVRLTDFHVCPLCSPTRASLLTGRHCREIGVTGTNYCQNLMSRDMPTMADVFAANGYRTAQFGKWHLGENYPYRPHDRGFDEATYHGNGAITSIGDVDWRNDYFDDFYMHNGRKQRYKGYCTDIWFREAMRFIREDRDTPFFCYIATNAPHGPYLVDSKYSEPYAKFGPEIFQPRFYGMISSIDENMGRLIAFLKNSGLEENTILIFMTDNGSVGNTFRIEDPTDPDAYHPVSSVHRAADTAEAQSPAALAQGYNAGMRGQKGSSYDGGHRVPFFIHWPRGKLGGGRDVDRLCAHIDVLPTLIDLCGIEPPAGTAYDGVSLRALLEGKSANWPDRTVVESYREVVMTQRWRLIHGKSLYDIQADPQQLHDIAEQHPEVVKQLQAELARCREKYDHRKRRIIIGSDEENPVRFTPDQWRGVEGLLYKKDILAGSPINGYLLVAVDRDGVYDFSLMRWPEEVNTPIRGPFGHGAALNITQARLRVNDVEVSKDVSGDVLSADFSLPLEAGDAKIETWLVRDDGSSSGAYYLRVARRDKGADRAGR